MAITLTPTEARIVSREAIDPEEALISFVTDLIQMGAVYVEERDYPWDGKTRPLATCVRGENFETLQKRWPLLPDLQESQRATDYIRSLLTRSRGLSNFLTTAIEEPLLRRGVLVKKGFLWKKLQCTPRGEELLQEASLRPSNTADRETARTVVKTTLHARNVHKKKKKPVEKAGQHARRARQDALERDAQAVSNALLHDMDDSD